jgi:hypothetical protein
LDNAALIAFSGALEMEFAGLLSEVEAIAEASSTESRARLAEQLVDALPDRLAHLVLQDTASQTLESAMATHYAEGVASVHIERRPAIKTTGRLMRADRAFEAVEKSGVLKKAANPVLDTREAIRVRASAVTKVVKGHIIQTVKDKLAPESEVKARETVEAKSSYDQFLATSADELAAMLADLSGNYHVQNAVEASTSQAEGYGKFSSQQTEDYLRRVQFQELYRAENRAEWREWPKRWDEQGGSFYPGASDYKQGRMIAEVQSRIWDSISDPAIYPDGTGNPYAPFAYGSGMDVKPVPANQLVELGLRATKQTPRKLSFNANVSFESNLEPELKHVLLHSMKDWQESEATK